MTDLDAIWLQNPISTIYKYYSVSDIIGTRGSWPFRVSKILGVSICMGFVFIKSNNNTIKLYEEFNDNLKNAIKPDDQQVFNELLLSKNLTYDTKPSFENSTISDNSGVFFMNNFEHESKMRVTLLSQISFRRLCTNFNVSEVIVLHCYSSNKQYSHKQIHGHNEYQHHVKLFGAWLLKEDWKNVSVNTSDLHHLIKAISNNQIEYLKNILVFKHLLSN
jgi:hypothetical protein